MVGVKPRSRSLQQGRGRVSSGWGGGERHGECSPVSLVQHEHLKLLGVTNSHSILIPFLLRAHAAAPKQELLKPAGRPDEDVGTRLVKGRDVLAERLPADQEERRREGRG